MTARQIDRQTDNIVIGAGEVYIDLFDSDGNPTGERYLGDAVGATLSIATEETTVFSGTGPVARELTRVVRSISRTFNLTLHDITLDNLALFTIAEVAALSAKAAAIMDETALVRPGRWYQLGDADRPAGVSGLATPADKAAATSAVTIASTAATPVAAVQAIEADRFKPMETEQKGQYVVDFERARIYWLPADHALYAALAGIAADTEVGIDYTPADPAREQAQGGLMQQRGTFRYLEEAAAGRGRNFYAPLCVITPGGDLAMLDGRSTEQQITLAVSAIDPPSGRNPLYIDGQPS